MATAKSKRIQARSIKDSSRPASNPISTTAALKQAEQKLAATQDALRRYEGIVSASNDFMALVDTNYTYQAISPLYLEAFGKAKEEIIGHHVADVLGAEVFEARIKPQLDRTLAGQHSHYQHWLNFPRWGRRYVDAHFDPFYAANGSISGIVVHVRDITEHKQAEEALQESEERFRHLIEGSIQGILIHRKWKPLFANQAYANILGYDSPDEILAMDSREQQIAPYDRARLHDYMEARFKHEDAPKQYEYDAVRKDGSIITLENVVRVVSWEGRPAIQSTVIDITERKQAEKALRESEERYRNLIEGSIQGILIERYRKPLFANQALANILGYSLPDEVLAMTSVEQHVASYERARLSRYAEARLEGKDAPVHYEYDAVRKDGSIVTLENLVRVVSWEGQTAIQNTVIDITARKKLDVLLRETQAMAKVGGWEIDLVDKTLTWTDELYRIHDLPVGTGITLDKAIGFFHPDSKPEIERALQRATDYGEPWDIELRKYTATGRPIWVRTVGKAFLRDGKAYRLAGTFQDITARKEAEQALRESEERFRNLIEGSIQGIIIQRDWKPLFVNQAYVDMLGYNSPAEILAMESIEEHFAAHERERLRRYKEARQRGEPAPVQYEYEAVRNDGSIIIVQNVVRVINWEGQPAVQSTVIDVSEHKRAEEALRNSEERMQALLDNAPALIFLKDRDGRYSLVNRRFEELFNVKDAELRGKTVYDLGPRDEADKTAARDREVVEQQRAVEYECRVSRPDGEYVFVTVKFPIFNSSGEVTAIGGVDIDITRRKRAEEALRASEKRYQTLYDDNPSMFFTLDDKGTILSANRFGVAELGYDVKQLVGKPVFMLHPEHQHVAVREHLEACFQDPDTVHRWEACKVRRDGTVVWVRETSRVVKSVNGISTMFTVCEDITEAHNLSQQLSYQASHDSLTGLVNRREFERRLRRALKTAQAERIEHAVCYLDLDQFKVINDTCGHVAGDELLRQLGALLQERVRKRDTLARLGGDEFGILVERCSLEQARRVSETLRTAITDFRFVWGDKTFSVGVSIGLVPITEASGNIINVLSTADTACYAAKDKGRNRIYVYHEDDAELAKRHGEMQWVARIHAALERDRFHLGFQPIMPLGDQDGTYYELLLRMKDEDGRVVLPNNFLPAAERYNLATVLDRWVVERAFSWLTAHPRQLERLSLCSINLCGHSIENEKFLEFIIRQFGETGLPPEKICFEVTETVAITNLASANRFIKALKGLGCRFALDDFGSGLSSFAYLKNLPVDLIKIDGVFVKDIVDDPIAFAMVNSINEIGHVMGKQTIAEFVENEVILKKLKEIGVDYAQGYAVGRPRPIDEMI
ncbi:MAG: PAS domain S-box protein [Acidiferrobacterales bacterium]